MKILTSGCSRQYHPYYIAAYSYFVHLLPMHINLSNGQHCYITF